MLFRSKLALYAASIAFALVWHCFKHCPNAYVSVSVKEYIIDVRVVFDVNFEGNVYVNAKFNYPQDSTDAYVDVRIRFGRYFSEQDFERFHWFLYETIRHEYEHFNKYLKGFWPDDEYRKIVEDMKQLGLSDIEKAKVISRYMLHYIEIDSYVKSIIYVAKKRKVPCSSVIWDILDRFLFENNKATQERMMNNPEISQIVNDIKDGLLGKIQKIFPKAILSDSFVLRKT